MGAALISDSDAATSSASTSKSGNWDEEALVAAAKSGSRTAFEQLVERYQERVFHLAQSVARNREDAEEITQDAFAQAFKNLSRFRGDSRFYTWLVRITINAGLMKFRRRRIHAISIDDQAERGDGALSRELEDCGPTPERWCLQRELQRILATSIGRLPPGYRSVFELRAVEGFSTEETARALDISMTAVKSRLRRARLQLRESLSQRFQTARGIHTYFRQACPAAFSLPFLSDALGPE